MQYFSVILGYFLVPPHFDLIHKLYKINREYSKKVTQQNTYFIRVTLKFVAPSAVMLEKTALTLIGPLPFSIRRLSICNGSMLGTSRSVIPFFR